jgi:hypothetical protein
VNPPSPALVVPGQPVAAVDPTGQSIACWRMPSPPTMYWPTFSSALAAVSERSPRATRKSSAYQSLHPSPMARD